MRKLLIVIPLIVFLAACGGTGGQGTPATPPPLPTTTAAQPTSAAVTPTAQVTPGTQPTQPVVPYPGPDQAYPPPGQSVVNAPAEIVQAVRDRLAAYLQKPVDQLMVQQAEGREWPDESLGCPEAGKTYAQVIIPGYLLTVTDGSQSYAVHTSLTALPGEAMVLCNNQVPVDLSTFAAPTPAPSADAQKMAELAKQDLAQKLGIEPSAITVVSTSTVEWNDSSLGCPKPDVSYLQVITSGYIIRLEAQGTGYEYHTDTGNTVVQCIP